MSSGLLISRATPPIEPCGDQQSALYVATIDQQHNATVLGGLGAPVVQSFTPEQNTSAGIDFRAHGTGSLTADFRVTLYSSYEDSVLSGLVATADVVSVDRGTDAQVRWDPAVVTSGTTYYFKIELLAGSLVVGTTGMDYPGGQVLEGGGNLGNTPDIYFITYYAESGAE